MKKLTLFSILFISAASWSTAQVMEESRVMSQGLQPALSIVLPGADTKLAEAEWKEFMKPYGRISRVKKSPESVISEAQILEIGGVNRLNVYFMSESVAEGAKMVVWVDMGGGYVSSTTFPDAYTGTVKLLQNFAHQVKVSQVATELGEQEKQLTGLQNDLGKLQKENEKLHKIIEDARARIAQAELDIVKNLQDQEAAQAAIDTQSGVVNEVSKKLEQTKALKPN